MTVGNDRIRYEAAVAAGSLAAAGSSHFSPFPPSLVEVSSEHEWTSELGERETTAECRVVGHEVNCLEL